MWGGLGRRAVVLAALLFGVAQVQAQVAEHVAACAGCHGADGNSDMPGSPSLAGQPKVFLENYLVLSREGLRGPEAMQLLLKGMPDREIVRIAAYYTRLPVRHDASLGEPELVQKGREIAQRTRCGSCHLPDYSGQQQNPRLAGQREDFLTEVMLAYQQNRRLGGDTLMSAALYGISEGDIRALAHFFARQR